VSSTDITPRPLELTSILDGIAAGTVVLPDFQRDFVWGQGDVLALIATVMVGWPAGSLLLMRGIPTFFMTKEFQGAPVQQDEIEYVVLDGQQRLTALYRAFRRSGGVVYAVSLDDLPEGRPSAEVLEEALRTYSLAEWDATMSIEAQARARLVPLFALSSASDYFQWRDRVVAAAAPAVRRGLSEDLARAYKDFLGNVNHYDFPAVILDNRLPTEAVARIFERINRGGQELSTFDLLVARSYSRDWNLRDEWNRARSESSLINAYLKENGLPIIQALALRRVQDIRRPALLNLDRNLIQEEWQTSVESMEQALQFLVSSGMRHPEWLPYETLPIPLAALAPDRPLNDHREQLEAWLWGRSFAGEYDVASSTKIAADYLMLGDTLAARGRRTFAVPTNRLLGATRRQGGSLWRAFLSLMLRRGALDPFDGDPLVPDPGAAAETTVVSLYPRTANREDAPHLRLLSQVLVRRGRRRGTGRAGALLELLQVARGHDAVDDRLRSQFLPEAAGLEEAALDPERLWAARSMQAVEYLVDDLDLLEEEAAPQA
jgi:hypothetical protein